VSGSEPAVVLRVAAEVADPGDARGAKVPTRRTPRRRESGRDAERLVELAGEAARLERAIAAEGAGQEGGVDVLGFELLRELGLEPVEETALSRAIEVAA